MSQNKVSTTKEFKNKSKAAILSIFLFVFVYILLLTFAIALAAGCIYLGILLLLTFKIILILLGVGIMVLGIFALYFVVKFLFKRSKRNTNEFKQITRQQHLALFKMIDEIVSQVGTDSPKKVYLTPEVNASVFYDSSFWSMFFPIRKNLTIGMGLINTSTEDEFKAVLSHEFGHFSQKSMKVGSYVYNVNRIIHNMLYDNDDYANALNQVAGTHAFITLFAVIAAKIAEGIQWILRQVYGVVNKSHLALSREMEFHADEIAASITGQDALIASLSRMSLADYAFNATLSQYSKPINEMKKSQNIYKEQTFVMNLLAKDKNIQFANDLPIIQLDELNQYNKSKLVIEDQWASHPTMEERIYKLKQTPFQETSHHNNLAIHLFTNPEEVQQELTNSIFSGRTDDYSFEEFSTEFTKEFKRNAYSKSFNGYYDNKNPDKSVRLDGAESTEYIDKDNLFSQESVERVYESIGMQNDLNILNQIQSKLYKIKTFDYDGKKYKAKEAASLIKIINAKLDDTNEKIKQNDQLIFNYFQQIEKEKNIPKKITTLYLNLFNFEKEYDEKIRAYNDLNNRLGFLNFETEIEKIQQNLANMKPAEFRLRESIKMILNDEKFSLYIDPKMKENFIEYTKAELNYFGLNSYFDSNLTTLFTAMNDYTIVLDNHYLKLKKDLLNHKEKLLKTN